ncbi:hypothetical protein [Streptomyces sp. NPDC059743]|uniref:hypothetical protein n=1 Tax=Streptomyces sp. NPDC059743 TaxID=3346928 RepID=UPI00365DFC40
MTASGIKQRRQRYQRDGLGGLADGRSAKHARRGMTIRSLAEHYKIPPWTVHLALDTSRPAEREVFRGRDPLRGRLIGLIDSVITDNLNVRGIWTKLMDDHDHSVSYASVRYHLKHQQDRGARPGDEAAQSKLNRTP